VSCGAFRYDRCFCCSCATAFARLHLIPAYFVCRPACVAGVASARVYPAVPTTQGSIVRFKGLTQSGEQLNGRFAVVTGYVGGGRGGGEEEEEEEGEDEDEEEEKDQEDAGLATASSIL
jgi:hypothetical protein